MRHRSDNEDEHSVSRGFGDLNREVIEYSMTRQNLEYTFRTNTSLFSGVLYTLRTTSREVPHIMSDQKSQFYNCPKIQAAKTH